MKENPAHQYREIAKRIVAKIKENLTANLENRYIPDQSFNLEQAIVDAMRYADQIGGQRAQEYYIDILKQFEDQDGTTSS